MASSGWSTGNTSKAGGTYSILFGAATKVGGGAYIVRLGSSFTLGPVIGQLGDAAGGGELVPDSSGGGATYELFGDNGAGRTTTLCCATEIDAGCEVDIAVGADAHAGCTVAGRGDRVPPPRLGDPAPGLGDTALNACPGIDLCRITGAGAAVVCLATRGDVGRIAVPVELLLDTRGAGDVCLGGDGVLLPGDVALADGTPDSLGDDTLVAVVEAYANFFGGSTVGITPSASGGTNDESADDIRGDDTIRGDDATYVVNRDGEILLEPLAVVGVALLLDARGVYDSTPLAAAGAPADGGTYCIFLLPGPGTCTDAGPLCTRAGVLYLATTLGAPPKLLAFFGATAAGSTLGTNCICT